MASVRTRITAQLDAEVGAHGWRGAVLTTRLEQPPPPRQAAAWGPERDGRHTRVYGPHERREFFAALLATGSMRFRVWTQSTVATVLCNDGCRSLFMLPLAPPMEMAREAVAYVGSYNSHDG